MGFSFIRARREKKCSCGGNLVRLMETQSWFLGHPPAAMNSLLPKGGCEKRMTYQDCIPRPLTSSRIPDKIECCELVFSSTALLNKDWWPWIRNEFPEPSILVSRRLSSFK